MVTQQVEEEKVVQKITLVIILLQITTLLLPGVGFLFMDQSVTGRSYYVARCWDDLLGCSYEINEQNSQSS